MSLLSALGTMLMPVTARLQDRFFIRAEALVGVWKNKPQEHINIA